MAEFRIDVVVDPRSAERGLSRVNRSMRASENQADRLRSTLLRTFQGIGVGLLVNELVRLADTFTNIQNRLRLVTSGNEELAAVTDRLFRISNQTRSSFESTAALYSRLALSARELGVSQEEVLQFTQSLNQAVILSGASANEAEAAIIQLSQGLASGRLQGDELRSVLEQLPVVADIIARELGITRGELRQFGAEGRITAQVVLRAFRNAQESLGDIFADTVPTISQSFTILRNESIRLIGQFDEASGVSESLSRALIQVSLNLGTIARVAGTAAAALIAYTAASSVSSVISYVNAQVQLVAALATGRASLISGAAADRARAAATTEAATAEVARTTATLAGVRAEEAKALATLNGIRATSAALLAERNLELVRLQAQISDRGRQLSLTRLAEIRTAEAAIIRQVTAAETALATARTATTAAEQRLAAAEAQRTAALTAQAGVATNLSRVFSTLRTALSGALRIIGGLPVLIATSVAGLILFADRIQVSNDGIATLADVAQATFNRISPLFAAIGQLFSDTFGPLADFVSEIFDGFEFDFRGVVTIAATSADSVAGVWIGNFAAIRTIWEQLPDVFRDIGIRATNSLIRSIESGINQAIEAINTINEFIGRDLLDPVTLGQLENRFDGAGAALGGRISESFNEAVEGTTFARDAVNSIFDEAEEIAQRRAAALADIDLDEAAGAPPVDPATVRALDDINRNLQEQLELSRLVGIERQVQTEINRVENQLRRQGIELSESELEALRERTELPFGQVR